MTHLVNVYFTKSDDKSLDGRTNSSIIMMNSMVVTTNKDDDIVVFKPLNKKALLEDAHRLIIRVCSSNSGIETERFILELSEELLQDITPTTHQLKPVWNGTFVLKALIWLCEHGYYDGTTLRYPDSLPIEKFILQNIIRTGFFYYNNCLYRIIHKKKNDDEFSYQGKTYTIL